MAEATSPAIAAFFGSKKNVHSVLVRRRDQLARLVARYKVNVHYHLYKLPAKKTAYFFSKWGFSEAKIKTNRTI